MPSGYCYAIEVEGAYKFGFSERPWSRLANAKTFQPTAKMRGFVPATRFQEATLHDLLKPYCVGGELYEKRAETDAIAALFPQKVKAASRVKAANANYKGEKKKEAKELVRCLLLPGEAKMAGVSRIGQELGIPFQRIRALWYLEARVIHAEEIAILSSAVGQLAGCPDRPLDRG